MINAQVNYIYNLILRYTHQTEFVRINETLAYLILLWIWFYTHSWVALAHKTEIIVYLKSYHLYIDLRGRHPNITASETTYMQDDQSTVGLVLALICGVGSIFICFAFVAICYRWFSKCFNVLSFSRGILNVMCRCVFHDVWCVWKGYLSEFTCRNQLVINM